VFSQLIIVWTKGDSEMVMLACIIVHVAVSFMMAIMRCLDAGYSKALSILVFIPIAHLFLFIAPSKR